MKVLCIEYSHTFLFFNGKNTSYTPRLTAKTHICVICDIFKAYDNIILFSFCNVANKTDIQRVIVYVPQFTMMCKLRNIFI